MKYLIISCSLDPHSLSFALAQHAHTLLTKQTGSCEFIDLRDYSLPLCNGSNQSADTHEHIRTLHNKILKAEGILIATPVYNYDVSASCKNLLELTGTSYEKELSGKAWDNKIVGILAAAGSPICYMAPLGLINSLILDFRCIVLPRFVYASQSEFTDGAPHSKIQERIHTLTADLKHLVERLA